MFDFLYKTDKLKDIFGDYFCGPDKLDHGEETLIAKYEKEEGSDGYNVEIYCISMPAEFFTIKALDSKSSIGEFREGFFLTTGSGCAREVLSIATMIGQGMLWLKD